MLHVRKESNAPGRKVAGPRLAVLIVLLALGPGAAWSQQPPQINEEIARQEKIYGSRGDDVPRGYVTSRNLGHYSELLPAGFTNALRKLGSSDRWLDIGAGGGQAILDYQAPEYEATPCENCPPGKAAAVAISIEDRRTERWQQQAERLGGNQIRYFHGKRLREYSREELGKFQIITDVYGGFSYTDNLSQFMEKVLGLLETGGAFYTLVQSVRLADGKDDPSTTWYLTELVDAGGYDVKICSWMKSISCVKVACESRSDWHTPTELIQVEKVCGDTSVPHAKLLQFQAGNPPGRRFQLENREGGRAAARESERAEVKK